MKTAKHLKTQTPLNTLQTSNKHRKSVFKKPWVPCAPQGAPGSPGRPDSRGVVVVVVVAVAVVVVVVVVVRKQIIIRKHTLRGP